MTLSSFAGETSGEISKESLGGGDHVRIVDYVDSRNAMLLSMYRHRIKAYRKMGYELREPHDMLGESPPRTRWKVAAAERQGLALG